MKILVTGGAGFIGFHLTRRILDKHPDASVVSIDNLNDYYDQQLKNDRLEELSTYSDERFEFHKLDLSDKDAVTKLFGTHKFSCVVNLAAQAGVRYARENPESYIRSNVEGFFNLINESVKQGVGKFLYASSSSVYGANTKMPFQESDVCASPMSLYAATKLSDEMIASSYFYTAGFKTIGLRLFNVYGPWGRPDMAYYKWSEALTKGDEIELRNKGNMYRDMTFVDDVVKAIDALIFEYEWENTHEVFNVGNRSPVKIKDVLEYLQKKLGATPKKIVFAEPGAEEPLKTFADTSKLQKAIGFAPDTAYQIGLDSFVEWYRNYKA